MKTYTYQVKTHKEQEFVDLSSILEEVVSKSGVVNGKLTVFCPHTTAGLTINENADPDVVGDMIRTLDKVFPIKGDYRHFEGNSHAHLKSSFVGVDQTVLVENSRMILGTWQSVYFCEFDGPRSRKVIVGVEGAFNG